MDLLSKYNCVVVFISYFFNSLVCDEDTLVFPLCRQIFWFSLNAVVVIFALIEINRAITHQDTSL